MKSARSILAATVASLAVCIGVASAAPLGQITIFTAPGTNIAQVRAGPDGNLWFTDRAGKIGQITTSGAITLFGSGLNAGAQPFSIAMGPDGNMWFTDAGTTSAIGMINPKTHGIVEFSTGLNAGSKPAGIALGPDGNLWFTDNGSPGAVGVINPTTHAISEFTAGLNAGSLPQQGIGAGPDGNLWFTDRGTTKAIGSINPTTHAIAEYSTGLLAGSAPGAAIVLGTDGNLWFVDAGTTGAIGMINPVTHVITEFPSGTGSAPGRIAVGPDGNLWYTDKGTTPAIAFINPVSHVFTKFSPGLPTGSLPGGIGTGADGSLWFTDQGTTRAMGRAGSGAPNASVALPSVGGSLQHGTPQTCGGALWSTWAGEQPSLSLFGFDGFQWLLDGAPIAGATGSTYTPSVADVGHALSCTVTGTYPLIQVTVASTSAATTVLTTAPVLSLPGPITVAATGPDGAVVTFTATATDLIDGTVPVTCTPASGSVFPIGTTTVHCNAVDSVGNTASGSFTVTVTASDLGHVTIDFTGERGSPVIHWDGDVVSGVLQTVTDGSVDWLAGDATFGNPAVALSVDLRSKHVGRLMTGSLTASRGPAWIRFGTTVAPFALGSDGSIWNPIPIRASYYDGTNVTFGWVMVRFS